MNKDIAFEINKDFFRKKLITNTWKAYHMLPNIDKPRILDIGCGSGIPTIELAVLSKGQIKAVDKDNAALLWLKEKIKALFLTKHIKTYKCDITKLKFKKNYFDIIWSEGAVSSIGFINGIKMWHRFLKNNGYMVIHDEIKDYQKKLQAISECGYKLLNHFTIPAVEWFNKYFKPLEKRILELKNKYSNNSHAIEILEKEEYEIALFKSRPDDFGSVFYIIQKNTDNSRS